MNSLAALTSTISAIATVAIALLTYFSSRRANQSTLAALKSAQAAQESVDATRESYVASERPWIKVDAGPGDDLVKTESGIDVNIHFNLQNCGKSPARNVCLSCQVITLKLEGDQFSNAREEAYKTARLFAQTGRGLQLFPAEDGIHGWKTTLTSKEMESSADHSSATGLLPSFFVIGSVFYKSVFDNRELVTDFTFQVIELTGDQPSDFRNVPCFSESFPKANIRFRHALHFYPGNIW